MFFSNYYLSFPIVPFFLFLMKQHRTTERNARKNGPPSETKTTTIIVEWCPEGGGTRGGDGEI